MHAAEELRLSRIAALNLTLRVAPYVSPLVVRSDVDVDAVTNSHIQLQVQPGFATPWAAELTALLSFKTFNVHFGVGYGNYFLRGLWLVTPEKHVFPILDFFWRW